MSVSSHDLCYVFMYSLQADLSLSVLVSQKMSRCPSVFIDTCPVLLFFKFKNKDIFLN